MKKTIQILIVLLCSQLATAAVDIEKTTARGYGESYLSAVDNALISAVQQVRGVDVKIAHVPLKMFASQQQANMILGGGSSSSSTVAIDTTRSVYLKRFKGYVKSYRVIASSQQPDDQWQVDIEADLYKYTPPKLGAVTRESIAVMTLHSSSPTLNFFDKNIPASVFLNAISAELDTQLLASDKFDLLDRKYLADISRENNLVTSMPETHSQQVLLGMIAGADYILTGTVRDFRVGDISRGSETLGFTSHKYQAKVTIDMRIVATGSTKVIAADTIDLWLDHQQIIDQRRDTNDFGQLDISDQQLIIARLIAQQVSDKTIESIFPAKVAALIDGKVIINLGGANVNIGDKYKVQSGRQAITDPDTGMPLGQYSAKEIYIQVSEVNVKFSVADLITGNIQDISIGDKCQLITPVKLRNQNGKPGNIQPTKSGGIILPGD